jgi:hypothetical protein
MPALRLRSGQAPAASHKFQAAAGGLCAWIPAFVGMTLSQLLFTVTLTDYDASTPALAAKEA